MVRMKRLIGHVCRFYSEDAAYRNFVCKDYMRRLEQHHRETDAELEAERKFIKTQRLNKRIVLLIAFFASISLISMVFFTRAVVIAFTLTLLFILASFSTVYKRKLGIPLGGIELVTFGTVLTAVAFGPVVGMLFGLVSSIGSELFSQNIGPLTLLYVITLGGVGLFAGYFSQMNIVLLGIAATIAALLINQVAMLFIGDEEVKSFTAFYIVANTIFNFVVFSTLGQRALNLLTY